MNARRDYRGNRTALFDGIEEGGIRASHEIDEHDNDRAMDGLQDRVIMLKRVIYMRKRRVITVCWTVWAMIWISSRGILSGTMDEFKMVFEAKSSHRTFTLVAAFVVIFLIIYYLTK